jgi:DNA topoisomerase IB
MDLDLIAAVGKVRGRMTNKENRAAKIIHIWDDLLDKFRGMVVRGQGRTETARLAYSVLVMMETGIRVGNESSAEGFVCENKWSEHHGKVVKTYGLTTLQHRHVRRGKGRYYLDFTGKKGVNQRLAVEDGLLLEFAPPRGKSNDLWLNITYPDLFKFVRRSVGRGFNPKDIRTAKVNLLFCENWADKHTVVFAEAETKSARKKVVRQAIEEVATKIGHTPGVCRSSYMSRGVLGWLLG